MFKNIQVRFLWIFHNILLILFLSKICGTNAFTAMSDMQQFLKVEEIIIKTLKPYLDQQEKDLKILKNQLADLEQIYHNFKDLTHPFCAYVALKEFPKNWKNIEEILDRNNGTAVRRKLMSPKSRLPFPKYDDMRGAAAGLLRIQKIYNLTVANIAEGDLKSLKTKTKMSVSDCFEMGVHAHNEKDYDYAVLWLQEAINRLKNNSDITSGTLKLDILDYLALSHYHQGDFNLALNTTKAILDIMPDAETAKNNMAFFEKKIKENAENHTKDDTNNTNKEITKSELQIHYEKLCRQEIRQTAKVQAPLRCKHLRRTSFQKIAPFKMEEVSLDPYIVILYDVILDSEITFLKQFSKPFLERAKIIEKNGTVTYSTTRTGQSAWIFDDSPIQIQNIDKRVEDITGLTTQTAEPIQVVNYGIGGHYDTHFDFVGSGDKTSFPKTGNRIATILFYMTDVMQGGATVFPSIDLTIMPKKGSAALWYNLDTSGEPDTWTMHAACPVIQGDKWVCNKWLHEKGQEFLRPCTFVMKEVEDDELI